MPFLAFAKVNIFLKIVGTRGNYHELLSRFMVVKNLYDTLSFDAKRTNEPFELIGDFNCDVTHNTLYKIYTELKKAGFDKEVDAVMKERALRVEKKIPTGAGLGGGSSDAATFLKMLNETAQLGLSVEELMRIGARVGADVAFFVSGYESANVSGVGEVVELFDEPALDLQIMTPFIHCDTAEVYRCFRASFLASIEPEMAKTMWTRSSRELMDHYDAVTLNDLFRASLQLYPALGDHAKEGWFFSGSGSSFFKVKEKGKRF